MSDTAILIAVLNFNKSSATIQCLNSIDAMEKKGLHLDRVVVDNGSTAEDYAVLADYFHTQNYVVSRNLTEIEQHFPTLQSATFLCRNKQNLGFTGGLNPVLAMLANSGHDYVWLLNNDTLCDSKTLGELILLAKRQGGKCIVGSTILNLDGSIQDRGTVGLATFRGYKTNRVQPLEGEIFIRVDAVCGASMCLDSRIVVEDNMTFDDNLFLYGDENELSYRCLSQSIPSFTSLTSTVTHDGGVQKTNDSPWKRYYFTRNGLYIKRKHFGKVQVALLLIYTVLNGVRRYGFSIYYWRAIYWGITDFLGRRMGKCQHSQLYTWSKQSKD